MTSIFKTKEYREHMSKIAKKMQAQRKKKLGKKGLSEYMAKVSHGEKDILTKGQDSVVSEKSG